MKQGPAPLSTVHSPDGMGLPSGWVVKGGFLEEVTFDLSLKVLTKRKIKECWWEVVVVFHVEVGMCVQAQRFEALTFSRKCKWFPVTEAKAWRWAQRCDAGMEGLLEVQELQ